MLLVLFRGTLYRILFSYENCGRRPHISISSSLLRNHLDSIARFHEPQSILEIVNLSNRITANQLSYHTKASEINPNRLFPQSKTHCVGYSAFYASICNYLLEHYGFGQTYHCDAYCGKISFLGYDLHKHFENPFFASHDFNMISNSSGKEIICIDPILYDYFRIESITLNRPK
jgi:hypothetical protein